MGLTFQCAQENLIVRLSGDLCRLNEERLFQQLYQTAEEPHIRQIQIEGKNLASWDSTLAVALYHLKKIASERKILFCSDTLPKDLNALLDLSLAVDRKPPAPRDNRVDILEYIGERGIETAVAVKKGVAFIGKALASVGKMLTGRAVMRSVDFWTEMNNCGPKALLIVSLISFMVGLILAFVGAVQLKTFGAQIFVAGLVTIGMTRIMGAIMVGVIMAGRTGASYAATIGTMQVNEELDALKTMGIPIADFLVLPRLSTLVIVMPLLVMLADFAGIAGGSFVGIFLLGIPPEEYWKYAWQAFDLTNFLVGVFHGIVFGFVIALCGCYYGVYCGRNADSVGIGTTKAVVSAIVWMIVLTGIITFICEVIGI